MAAPTARTRTSRSPFISLSARRSRWARPWAFPAATMGIASATVFWLVHASTIDAAYITLSYARNVAFHLRWGLIPQRTSNTATSPLNVLALAGLTAVPGHPVLALAALFVGANVVLGCALLRTARALNLP